MEGSGGASNRRGFLRALMRDTAKGAGEVAKVVGPPGLRPLINAAIPSEAPPEPVGSLEGVEIVDAAPLLDPARAAGREVPIDELLEWAVQVGLESRLEALRTLAVPAVRLTDGTDDGPAWLGGEPQLPVDVDWPHWGGGLLDLVLQVDLAQVSTPLGASGHLLLFFDTLRAPSGESPGAEQAARALVVPAEAAERPRGAEPMRPTGELMLPRVWASAVQALELSPEEVQAFRDLRERLAAEQGVELEDDAAMETAHHRLLGLPNEVTGQMPLTCELTSRDLDSHDHEHEQFAEAEAAASRWRLLAQVSGTPAGRLYFWIPSADLEAGDLSTVRVIPRAS